MDEVNRLLEIDIEDTIYQTSFKQKQEIEEVRIQLSKKQGISRLDWPT